MTNRQALMRWLDTLSNEEFEEQVLSRRSDLPERVDRARCLACKGLHGGRCPLPEEDASCKITTADWLDMENGGHCGGGQRLPPTEGRLDPA